MKSKLPIIGGSAFVAIALLLGGWFVTRNNSDGLIVSTNGRIEAVEVHVATKLGGRIEEVFVREGDRVSAGDKIARLDTATLDARLREAQAQVEQAEWASVQAQSIAEERHTQCELAEKELDRAENLFAQGHVSEETLDQRRTSLESAEAECRAAKGDVSQSKAAGTASEAVVDRIRTDIKDSTLESPVDGQVLYRLAEPGEVLGVGGRVATIVDFSDFYLTVYLPGDVAGRLVTGDGARVVLDAFPDTPLPAVVSFVSPEAQFTPKEVETKDERQKLTFRVKLSILPEAFEPWLKPGMTGMGHVRLDQDQDWPVALR